MNFFHRAKATASGVVMAALLAAPLGVQAAMAKKPGQGVTIKMARATRATGWFQAEVYRQMLEMLGYSVDEMKACSTRQVRLSFILRIDLFVPLGMLLKRHPVCPTD